MGSGGASDLMNFSQLSLAWLIAILLAYLLIPTFIILSIIGIVRRININRKLKLKQMKTQQYYMNNTVVVSKKQKRINEEFESPKALSKRLGDIKEPSDKSRFSSLELVFDNKGKAIRNGG